MQNKTKLIWSLPIFFISLHCKLKVFNIKQTKSNKIKIIKILVEIQVYGFNFSKNLHLRIQDICRIQVTCNI